MTCDETIRDYIRHAQPITTQELVVAGRCKLLGNVTETMIHQSLNGMSRRNEIELTDDGWRLPRVKQLVQSRLFS